MSSGAPSPHSVLRYLSAAERACRASLPVVSQECLQTHNLSFHRPAASPASPLPRQAIPRHIVQTGSAWPSALTKHEEYVRSWLDLNPEYEYSFFSDVHAARFVARHGTRREREAYRRILTGSQRADLFRVIYLKVAGGVYADLDEELQRPLRELFGGVDVSGRRVPRESSAVVGSFWPFEFMLYVPQHPILVHSARIMTDGILMQVEWMRNQSKHACRGPHECIIRVTGPLAYTSGVGSATMGGGCGNKVRLPRRGQCDRHSPDPLLRDMFLCEGDKGTIWNSWSCGFARHWDCRNSDRRRKCGAKHYGQAKTFFDLTR